MSSRARPSIAPLAYVLAVALGGGFVAYRGQEPHIATVLSNSAKKLTQTLPVRISDDLTLVHAYQEALSIVFVYEIDKEAFGQTASEVIAGLEAGAVSRHCSDRHSGTLFEHKVTFKYIIKAQGDTESVPAIRFVIGPDNCKALSL